MRLLGIVLLCAVAACGGTLGGSGCTVAGTHAFTASFAGSFGDGACRTGLPDFPVRLTATVSGSSVAWTITEGATAHPAQASTGTPESCESKMQWVDASVSPALFHVYLLHADGTAELNIDTANASCVAQYRLR